MSKASSESLVPILYVVVGFMIVANPGAAAVTLTLLIALFLMFGGIFRIVVALILRFPHWGWLFLHGIVNLLLGIAIWRRWPWDGLWVIGLFIGIEEFGLSAPEKDLAEHFGLTTGQVAARIRAYLKRGR